MKRIALVIGGSLIFVQCSIGFTAATNITSYTGEIMDSHCAKMGSHETMKQKGGIQTEKQCTLVCVKMGGRFVLFNAAARTLYQLDDQQKPKQFAGERVKVMGTLNKTTKTIHVTDISRAS